VFTDQADLGEIFEGQSVGVSSIKHKAVVEVSMIFFFVFHIRLFLGFSQLLHLLNLLQVTKEGTEGAAVTGIQLVLLSAISGKDVELNRPFIFMVQDTQYKIPVLVGKVNNPTSEKVPNTARPAKIPTTRKPAKKSCKKCRPVIHCAGDFTVDEMEENTCQQTSGRIGLCCADVEKRPSAPSIFEETFGLRSPSAPMDASCRWADGTPVCGGAEDLKWRTMNGSCNNQERPLLGLAGTPQQRIADPAAYSAGGTEPRVARSGGALPSARMVTTHAFTSGGWDIPNRVGLTTLFTQMAQFISHDLYHNPSTAYTNPPDRCCQEDAEGRPWLYPTDQQSLPDGCFPIQVPWNDPIWGPEGRTCLAFRRANTAPAIPVCSTFGDQNQANAVTHWLDGSVLYGRQPGGQEPREVLGDSSLSSSLKPAPLWSQESLVPGLLHHLWTREHNRIAIKLTKLNAHWDSERVFQETRRIVVAMLQNVIYNEWLPILLGPQYMKNFNLLPMKPGQGYTDDYQSEIDPRINAEFSGAAFRFSHSMVPHTLNPIQRDGTRKILWLKDVVMDPSRLQEQGFVDSLLRGETLSKAPALDAQFSDDLLEIDANDGMDLVSIDIQRGRDFGIHGYNKYRKLCMSRKNNYREARTFEDLAKGDFLTTESIQKLKGLYDHVDDIDLFVGGMLEKPDWNGALLGPAFTCIIGDQFGRFKKADRFWFENGRDMDARFRLDQLDALRSSSLARVLCDNTDIDRVQPMPLHLSKGMANKIVDCKDIHPEVDLALWKEQ
jgi:peroxidase